MTKLRFCSGQESDNKCAKRLPTSYNQVCFKQEKFMSLKQMAQEEQIEETKVEFEEELQSSEEAKQQMLSVKNNKFKGGLLSKRWVKEHYFGSQRLNLKEKVIADPDSN